MSFIGRMHIQIQFIKDKLEVQKCKAEVEVKQGQRDRFKLHEVGKHNIRNPKTSKSSYTEGNPK